LTVLFDGWVERRLYMDFVKMGAPVNNGIRIVHCSYCDCDGSEKASLNSKTSKATGG
jgi:hypothetical protein